MMQHGHLMGKDRSSTIFILSPYSIYSVPANGGARSVLRYNAHHASWNPKGNKIAFDDNYGYIGTKDIYTRV